MHVNLITPDQKQSHKTSLVTEFSSISNLMIKKDNNLKIFTTFSTIFLIVSILLSIAFSFILTDKRILTFQYGDQTRNSIPDAFHINIYLFYLFLLFSIILNSFLVYIIFKDQDPNLLKIIFSDLKWNFILAQLFIGLPFIIGIAFKKELMSIIISFCLNLLCVILILFYYKNIKIKQNLSYSSFICSSLYISLIFSFMTFISFYNFSELLINSLSLRENGGEVTRDLEMFSIVSYSLYFLIAIILLTYFKDVIYCFVMIYFLFGFLVNKNFNLHQVDALTLAILITFTIIACLVTIIKYGKSVFGYESEEYLNEVLNERAKHKKSSWFYVGQN